LTVPVSGYVYDVAVAGERARSLRGVLPEWARLLYAVKANSFGPVLAALACDGGVDGFEVASAAEAVASAAVLREAGRPVRLAAAGPAKGTTLLAELLDAGVEVVHAESALELARLSALGQARGQRVRVGLRVNPQHVALTGTLSMAGHPSPFGIPEADVPAALALAHRLPGLDVVGFHVHAVCGNRDARAHAAYISWCLSWAVRTAAEHGVDLRWLDVGGGLGVAYGGQEPLDLAVLGEQLASLHVPARIEIALEPGRWLAADCGWYAAEVVDVKQSGRRPTSSSAGEVRLRWYAARGDIAAYAGIPGLDQACLLEEELARTREGLGPGTVVRSRTACSVRSRSLLAPGDARSGRGCGGVGAEARGQRGERRRAGGCRGVDGQGR